MKTGSTAKYLQCKSTSIIMTCLYKYIATGWISGHTWPCHTCIKKQTSMLVILPTTVKGAVRQCYLWEWSYLSTLHNENKP